MAARSISSAAISFGLVSIPVKLFTTHESGNSLSFNWLHNCGSRVKQQYWCPTDERVTPREELIKGYEFQKGQFVTFTQEELHALEEEGSDTIEITEFLPLEAVDPLYFDQAYYLGPDKGGDKPYRLLGEAMRSTKRAALAKWAARGKQYLVLIRPFQDGLVLQQLSYANEIKSFDEIQRGDTAVKPAELDLAVKLIDQISTDAFHPERYEDSVKLRIEAAIQRKIEGQESIAVEPTAAPEAKIIDLMEALRASLSNKETAAQPARKGMKKVNSGAGAKVRGKSSGGSKQ